MNFEQYQMQKKTAPTIRSDDEEQWPPPLFLAPRLQHNRTFIILHGRGDTAHPFGYMLASLSLPSYRQTLPEIFPEAKFIFPSSKPRDLAVVKGMKATQWFDMSSLVNPDEQQELQYEGLHDSTVFIHDIIRQEASFVGLENIILGGLSQGCALGLHVMMSFPGSQGNHLGGFFGMSGWLPFTSQLEAISKTSESPVAGARHAQEGRRSRAIQFVKEHVVKVPDDGTVNEMEAATAVPIFLGHGTLDMKVDIRFGERAARVMGDLGWKVTWKFYPNLGHWYCPEELEDVVKFVKGEKERVIRANSA